MGRLVYDKDATEHVAPGVVWSLVLDMKRVHIDSKGIVFKDNVHSIQSIAPQVTIETRPQKRHDPNCPIHEYVSHVVYNLRLSTPWLP